MTTLDKANWLYTNGFFDGIIFTLSDNEIDAVYASARGQCVDCCNEEVI